MNSVWVNYGIFSIENNVSFSVHVRQQQPSPPLQSRLYIITIMWVFRRYYFVKHQILFRSTLLWHMFNTKERKKEKEEDKEGIFFHI